MCLFGLLGALLVFVGFCIGVWTTQYIIEKDGYEIRLDQSRPWGSGRWIVYLAGGREREEEGREGEGGE